MISATVPVTKAALFSDQFHDIRHSIFDLAKDLIRVTLSIKVVPIKVTNLSVTFSRILDFHNRLKNHFNLSVTG